MTQIKYSVGDGGFNDRIDCAYIQILLNKKLAKGQGFSKLDEDGKCGTHTIKAIRHFQQTQAKIYHPDGRIDPNKQTYKVLISGLATNELIACWNQAVMEHNKGLIVDEQAKRAQATNKPLPEKLVPKPDYQIPSSVSGYSFPLDKYLHLAIKRAMARAGLARSAKRASMPDAIL